MDNIHFKEIIETKMTSYGISMAMSGRLYGERTQTFILEEKKSLQECEKHHQLRAEKVYNDIISLLDAILYITLNDCPHWKNNAKIISIETRKIPE